jgi:hypothetical protein
MEQSFSVGCWGRSAPTRNCRSSSRRAMDGELGQRRASSSNLQASRSRLHPISITHDFFRLLLRPAWLLRGIRFAAALAPPALLFARVPARPGTSLATRAALAPGYAPAVEDVRKHGARISRTY